MEAVTLNNVRYAAEEYRSDLDARLDTVFLTGAGRTYVLRPVLGDVTSGVYEVVSARTHTPLRTRAGIVQVLWIGDVVSQITAHKIDPATRKPIAT